MRVSSVTSLLGMNSLRGKKITVGTVMSFLQGLTDKQIEQIHRDGGKVTGFVAEPGSLFYLPAGYAVAMRPINNVGAYGLRFVTLHDCAEVRADLQCYHTYLSAGTEVDKLEATA